jgi:vacuolar-type H+-ATPase subunit H
VSAADRPRSSRKKDHPAGAREDPEVLSLIGRTEKELEELLRTTREEAAAIVEEARREAAAIEEEARRSGSTVLGDGLREGMASTEAEAASLAAVAVEEAGQLRRRGEARLDEAVEAILAAVLPGHSAKAVGGPP